MPRAWNDGGIRLSARSEKGGATSASISLASISGRMYHAERILRGRIRMSVVKMIPGIQADLEVLTAAEANEVEAGVDAERAQWQRRHPHSPLFTLGTASYVEGPRTGFSGYMAEASRTNPMLSTRFDRLFERIRMKVAAFVGGDARYEDRLALPGFHVMFPYESAPATVHFDQQYEEIDWSIWGHAD